MEALSMEEKYKHKIITIPNLLSFFRLLLIPVIMWLYIVKKDPIWTTVMLILSGVTDVVDGIIARKCNMISDFGKAFDPVADKLTQIAMLYCLVSRFKWMLLPLCVLVVKEITAGILGLLVIRKTGKVDGAVWHGKATTVSLYSMMIIHLIWFHIPGVVSGILIGGCTVLALLSAFLYTRENVKKLSSGRDNHA
ncbi:MAG: CDP-alcohol phosphatidyltransferase family protein [Ruminococcaceae bacterium]|nr:CDP-alcohol phosphatidyltransferase family protein [Oscillospiraceae bacterium]